LETTPSFKTFALHDAPGNRFAKLLSVSVKNKRNEIAASFPIDEPIYIEIIYQDNEAICQNTSIIHIKDGYGNTIFASNEFNAPDWEHKKPNQVTVARCEIPSNLLSEGTYYVLVAIGHYNPNMLHTRNENIISFKVLETYTGNTVRKHTGGNWPGLVRPYLNWDISTYNDYEFYR